MAIFVGIHRRLCPCNLCKWIQQFGIDSAVFKCTDREKGSKETEWRDREAFLEKKIRALLHGRGVGHAGNEHARIKEKTKHQVHKAPWGLDTALPTWGRKERGDGVASAGCCICRQSKILCKYHGVLQKQGKGAWVSSNRDFPGPQRPEVWSREVTYDGSRCIFIGSFPAIWDGLIPVPGS